MLKSSFATSESQSDFCGAPLPQTVSFSFLFRFVLYSTSCALTSPLNAKFGQTKHFPQNLRVRCWTTHLAPNSRKKISTSSYLNAHQKAKNVCAETITFAMKYQQKYPQSYTSKNHFSRNSKFQFLSNGAISTKANSSYKPLQMNPMLHKREFIAFAAAAVYWTDDLFASVFKAGKKRAFD